jgi:hypothetical protein
MYYIGGEGVRVEPIKKGLRVEILRIKVTNPVSPG